MAQALRAKLEALKSDAEAIIKQITKDDIRRLGLIDLNNPAALLSVIEMTTACVLVLLSDEDFMPKDTSWRATRVWLLRPGVPDDTYAKMASFNLESEHVSFKVQACSMLWKSPNFNEDFCAKQNRTSAILCKWVHTIVLACELAQGVRDFARELVKQGKAAEPKERTDISDEEANSAALSSRGNKQLVLATYHEKLTPADMKSIFDHYDVDSSGAIEMSELVALYRDILASPTATAARDAMDRNERILEGDEDTVAIIAAATMRQLDTTKDGKLQWSEFVRWRDALVRNKLGLEASVTKAKAALVNVFKQRSELKAVASMIKPSREVSLTLQAVMVMLTPAGAVAVDTSWPKLRSLVEVPNTFIGRLNKLDMDLVPDSMLDQIDPFLHHQYFDEAAVAKANRICGELNKWVHAVVSYKRALRAIELDIGKAPPPEPPDLSQLQPKTPRDQVRHRKAQKAVEESLESIRAGAISRVLTMPADSAPSMHSHLLVAALTTLLAPANYVPTDLKWGSVLAALQSHAKPDANAVVDEIKLLSKEGLPEDHLYLLQPYSSALAHALCRVPHTVPCSTPEDLKRSSAPRCNTAIPTHASVVLTCACAACPWTLAKVSGYTHAQTSVVTQPWRRSLEVVPTASARCVMCCAVGLPQSCVRRCSGEPTLLLNGALQVY